MKKLWRILWKTVSLIVLVAILFAGVLVYQGYQMYAQALEAKPLESRVQEVRSQADYTKIDDLPEMYRNAVVAAEDHRFYSHGGIDIFAISRALWVDVTTLSLAEGGSTITQQLAKNLYFTQEKELTRKIAEVFMAFELEAYYEKDEILELYVNSIYFGEGCYTVKAASQAYFGKDPAQMSDYESTLLAGIPNAPSVYALTENPDLARQRQRQVVAMMVKQNYLTEQEAVALQS